MYACSPEHTLELLAALVHEALVLHGVSGRILTSLRVREIHIDGVRALESALGHASILIRLLLVTVSVLTNTVAAGGVVTDGCGRCHVGRTALHHMVVDGNGLLAVRRLAVCPVMGRRRGA